MSETNSLDEQHGMLSDVVPTVMQEVMQLMLSCNQVTGLVDGEPTDASGPVGAVVNIAGDFLGSVAFRCTDDDARNFSTKIFELDEPELVRASLCELTNMVGGNLKCVLGDKCVLSTPKTLEELGSMFPLEWDRLIFAKSFDVDGCTVQIEVRKSELDVIDFVTSEIKK